MAFFFFLQNIHMAESAFLVQLGWDALVASN